MKKLMIAAAALTLGYVATAASCGESVVTIREDCPFGYQLKIFVKTTGAGGVLDACGEAACLRVPATRRLAGFIYGATCVGGTGPCGEAGGCTCNQWEDAEFLLWNYDTKAEVMPKAVEVLQLDRIFNGDTTTAEIAFRLVGNSYDFTLAGFGRTFKRNGIWTLKYALGFCAGVIPSAACNDGCVDVPLNGVWSMCASETAAPDTLTDTTAAYGKWTLDWSSTLYYRIQNGLPVTSPGSTWEGDNHVKGAALTPITFALGTAAAE